MALQIAQDSEADRVLDEYPFAILIGMALDQQYGMEHAFRGGLKLLQRLGTLDPESIATLNPETFKAACAEAPAIHRFPGSMAEKIQRIAAIVEDQYDGDVTKLWLEAADGEELLKRVTALPGFGQQKARIFIALLAKQLNVRPSGWEAVAGDYALDGWRSVADVVDAESLQKVRDYKKAKKAKAKSAGA
ncbi:MULTISPECIES: HhH-GPD-type base excision DNA repair protein [unclassified Aeromicrobium]|uniref:HhH-GPD-type base excision DNA repair protein n=1 Tax=unclassified Aeromicrobium TaxID=2633570 RepID=UPI00396AF493